MARTKISDIIANAKENATELLQNAAAEKKASAQSPTPEYKVQLAGELFKLAKALKSPYVNPLCVSIADVKAYAEELRSI